MGFLSNLFGKQKEPAGPVVITGLANTYDAPDSVTDKAPYVYAGYGWTATNPETVPNQWNDLHHYSYPDPGEPAEQWSGYNQEPKTKLNAQVAHNINGGAPQQSQNEIYRGFTDNPNRYPEKWTPAWETMRPTTYEFARDMWQWRGERQLNGTHFSMADNIRSYPLGGMRPANERNRRNTYRLNPPPWDEQMVDMPTPSELPQVSFNSPAPSTSNRAYRLG